MRLMRLVRDETHVGFMKLAKPAVLFSAVLAVLSVLSLVVVGLNYGIDFRGGAVVMAETPEPRPISEWRAALGTLEAGDVAVTSISDPAAELTGAARNSVMVRIGADDPNAAASEARALLEDAFPDVTILQTDAVGAKVSGELLTAGALALLLAVLAVLVYIWLRFEWQFAVGAVIALAHDVLITVGVFSITATEFNLSIIAALLTIIGYSLNDTVVIFDRVRENLRKFKTRPLTEVLDLAINETLSRTIMTSGTTLIALIALYVLGGEVIRGFTFGMIFGIVIGTYSSVFVAAAVLLWLGVTREPLDADAAAGVKFSDGGA